MLRGEDGIRANGLGEEEEEEGERETKRRKSREEKGFRGQGRGSGRSERERGSTRRIRTFTLTWIRASGNPIFSARRSRANTSG